MSDHTPGPWKVVEKYDSSEIWRDSDKWREQVALVPAINGPSESDAQLIAAAPDLLEACRAAAELLAQAQDQIETTEGKVNEAMRFRAERDCWAAIEKAEGDS